MPNISAEYFQGWQAGRDGFRRPVFSPATFARKAYDSFEDYAPSRIISTTAYAGYTVTALVAGTLVMKDAVGGVLELTGGASTQGIQMQSDGEIYLPAANKDIFFEATVEAEDADDLDWMVGLAKTDTDIFTTDPAALIVFRGLDASANIDFQVRDSGTGATTDTGTDLVNGTQIRLGFWVKGTTSVTPYINGVAQTPVTANIPTEELAITFGMQNGATTANQALGVDWYGVSQTR